MSATERKARDLFERAVLAKGQCVMRSRDEDPCDGACDPHHVIPKQWLKTNASTLSDQERMEMVWDARNGVPVCSRHHGLLTTRMRHLASDELPAEVWAFASARKLGWLLDRELGNG